MTEAISNTGSDTSRGFSAKLSAPGVYDPDKQLNDEQVVALKKRFQDSPELVGQVAVHIVEGLLPDSELDAEDPWFESKDELDTFKAGVFRTWETGLGQLIELPGAEWPEGVTPPATFAEALKELDAQAAQGVIDG
jgi:hypothetical protein